MATILHAWRLGYDLDDRGSRVRFPAGAVNFSLHHHVQNGSGANPDFYPMGTRDFFPGGKEAPQHAFVAWCSVKSKTQG